MTFPQRHRASNCSSASFDCDSEELDAIIKNTVSRLGGGIDETSATWEETSGSLSAQEEEALNRAVQAMGGGGGGDDPALRMSFAKWTAQDKKDWMCGICTYVNEPLHLSCAVCGKAKGAKAEDESERSSSCMYEDGGFAAGASGAAGLGGSASSNNGYDEDEFLEQLRRERHNEVLELQESILSQAAMELSMRDESNIPKNNSGRSNNPYSASVNSALQQQRQHHPASYHRQATAPAAAPAARPRSPSPLPFRRQPSEQPHHQSSPPHSPLSARRPVLAGPAQSALFDMSEDETREMRKILEMSSSTPARATSPRRTSNQTQQILPSTSYTMADDSCSSMPPLTSSNFQRRTTEDLDDSDRIYPPSRMAESCRTGADSRGPREASHHPFSTSPMSASSRTNNRTNRQQRRRQDRIIQNNGTTESMPVLQDANNVHAEDLRPRRITETGMDMDADILQKIAMRSMASSSSGGRRTDSDNDLPGLTSMAAAAPAAAAAARAPSPAAAAAPQRVVRPGAYSGRPGAQMVRNQSAARRIKRIDPDPVPEPRYGSPATTTTTDAPATTEEPVRLPSAVMAADVALQKVLSDKLLLQGNDAPTTTATGVVPSQVMQADVALQKVLSDKLFMGQQQQETGDAVNPGTVVPSPVMEADSAMQKVLSDKLSREGAAKSLPSPTRSPGARKSSGLDLDDDILQMIADKSLEKRPVKDSKGRGDMMQRAWQKSTTTSPDSPSPEKKQRAGLKKAAKGLIKGLPFRKKS